MRIPLAVSLAPLALALACSDEGPLQPGGPSLAIVPATVSVETGADPITLQASPQNGNLTGSVSWELLSGQGAGALGSSTGSTVSFTPSGLGTSGGNALVKATATVGGSTQVGTAAVTVTPSTHGRIALSIDPGEATAWVDILDPSAGTKATFVANAPTLLRSGIIDAGTYVVTADAGILVPGTVVDGTWDGTASFDGGTFLPSISVPVKPNLESSVLVRFTLRGGLGRLWLPGNGAIRGYAESELLVDHDTQTGFAAAGARAIAFDASGNLWATFSDGVRMYTPDTLALASPSPARTVSLADATGIAVNGDTVAVASCAGNSVSTFSRSAANPTPAQIITVTCPWGISFDGNGTGKLWVTQRVNGPNGHVFRFPAGGGTAETGAAVVDAYGVVVDANNPPNVWVSSCAGNFVQQVSPTVGSQLAFADLACPGGLAFDKKFDLWVLSAGTGTSPSGNLLVFTPDAGSGPGPDQIQLSTLTQVTFGGIAFDPAGAGLPVHQ